MASPTAEIVSSRCAARLNRCRRRGARHVHGGVGFTLRIAVICTDPAAVNQLRNGGRPELEQFVAGTPAGDRPSLRVAA